MIPHELPAPLSSLPFTRIHVPTRGWVFHAGQPHPGVYFVHGGFLKTVVGSEDGRERICSFAMHGQWLGLESLGSACHVSDCMALDASEVWLLPQSSMDAPIVAATLARLCAQQLREQQAWTLAITSLCAEHRVIAFLHEVGNRHARLGCSARRFRLRMTRAEMGNFLGLKIETVTRALTKLQACGVLSVDRREVTLLDPAARDTAQRPPRVARDRRACAGSRMRSSGPPARAHAPM